MAGLSSSSLLSSHSSPAMSSNSSTYHSTVKLCRSRDIQESELISQLQAILRDNSDVVYEQNERGWTLLHLAAVRRSPEFCQLLVSRNTNLVKTADNGGNLSLHLACFVSNTNTVKYLCRLYPESISIRDGYGSTPLERILYGHERANEIELIKFLLANDRGAVSTPDEDGRLPLHTAALFRCLAVVKLVFNAYPNAIHITDNAGDTPAYGAQYRDEDEVETGDFFQQQIELERQAHTNRTPDNSGQLPIHRALRNGDASLGGIKLMLAANSTSIALADNRGHTPLHIACQVGNLDAAKYLIGVDQGPIQATDTRGNLPLHLACAGGNCGVISCILDQSTYGVTLQNSSEQTPIELLLYESECDRDSMEYIEAIRCLFQVDPDDILQCLMMKKDSSNTVLEKQGNGNKRKRV